MRQNSPASFSRMLRNAVFAFLLTGTMALIAYSLFSWDREEKEVRSNLTILSSFLAAASQSFFDNLGNGLNSMGRLLDQKQITNNPEGSRELLRDFQKRYPEVAAMAVFAPDGRMLINTAVEPGGGLPDFRRDPPYIARLLQDMNSSAPYIVGAPEYGKAIRRWRFAVRHVVRDAQGRPLFLIQAAIPLEQKGSFLHQLPTPPGSIIGLLRSDGYLQARWPIDDTSAIYGRISEGPVARAVRAHPGAQSGYTQEDSLSIDSNGHRVGAFTRLAHADMYAYVSAPWASIWEKWWIHNAPVLLVSVLFLAGSFVAAYRLRDYERSHREELVAQARRDSLTGLPNRAAAEEMIQFCTSMSRALTKHFSIMFIDIDRFKDINDSLGHAVGDQLLIAVSAVMRQALREEGMLSRLGGDEFLVVLPTRDVDAAVGVAKRMILAFAEPIAVGEHRLQVTPSIGIAQFPEHGEDMGMLLKHADTAMYEAKRQGRNAFSVYMDHLGERVQQRVETERQLREALRQESFFMVYQPVLDMRTGRIAGAEALVRWMRSDGTVILPGRFIDIAEDSGLIHPLGEWVLRTTLKQLKQWNDAGHELWMAVNISPRQFQDPNLIAKISAALDESGVAPERLVLEITESMAMLNPDASLRILNNFKAMGLRIAIDDFGTGYSSLSLLKRIPTDKVKIDKSFVDGLDREVDDTAIVHMVLALAGVLQKTVVAEGVETQEQFRALHKLNCGFAQGYWISRPVLPMDFAQLLNKPVVLPKE